MHVDNADTPITKFLREKFGKDWFNGRLEIALRTGASDYLKVDTLRPMCLDEGNEEDALIGIATIAGVLFHVELYSVEEVTAEDEDESTMGGYRPTKDPCGRVDGLLNTVAADAPFMTIELDGFPGEWVLHIYPFCQ